MAPCGHLLVAALGSAPCCSLIDRYYQRDLPRKGRSPAAAIAVSYAQLRRPLVVEQRFVRY